MINKKVVTYLMSFLLFMSLISCISDQSWESIPEPTPEYTPKPTPEPAPSATESGPRTLILNGKTVSEDDVGGFTAWYCQHYYGGGRTLVEVGFFGDPKLKGTGFILYDGGYSGEYTFYRRSGLDHRWDWGPNGNEYAFVIQTDGTGLYYDFTTVPSGKSTKPSSLFQCHRR